MQLFVLTLLIGLSVSEKLPTAPYPPSGWRPNGAILHLPPEYSPQRLRQPIVEIRKENVQYAGQLGETTTAIPNDYLPPSATETSTTEYSENPTVLRVQGLPSQNAPAPFNGQYNELNTGEIIFLNKNPSNFQQNGIRPNRNQLNGQYQTSNRYTFAQVNKEKQEQNYIPPSQYYPPSQTEVPRPIQPESDRENDNDEENDGPTVAIANSVSNGQYYILGQDNTLQRVIYMTSQTEEDLRRNGFTAQLRYEPVQPIRDPIYAYDNQGHLVKVYNK
ncbi:uncharacterized protein LOC119068486 [Bradysia coprophila]|uniref:uncharacterized protein LOC119068486 n=1 Tax=Bradysia coprophila TaxID=38358 RepID=UPI00187D9C7F|nr:uncharacterized protein LOC119068486 [Bradysia coprophila]